MLPRLRRTLAPALLLWSWISLLAWQCAVVESTACHDECRVERRSLEAALAQFPIVQREMLRLAANSSTRQEARFVVFRLNGGELGNKIRALVSCFLAALLSRRGLLIDWEVVVGYSGDSFTGLFEPPDGLEMRYSALLQEWDVKEQELEMFNTGESHTVSEHFASLVMCADWATELDDAFISIHANEYFAPRFLDNKHHAADVLALFESGQEQGRCMFDQLVHYLLRPKAKILHQIHGFVEENMRGYKRVGMQLRQARRPRDVDVYNMSGDASVQLLFSCAASEWGEEANSTVFLLATDNAEMRYEATKWFGSSVVFRDRHVATDQEGMEDALIDLWLLGECDVVFTSMHSSFGEVASARTSRPTHVVDTKSAECRRASSPEPSASLGDVAKKLPCLSQHGGGPVSTS